MQLFKNVAFWDKFFIAMIGVMLIGATSSPFILKHEPFKKKSVSIWNKASEPYYRKCVRNPNIRCA